MREVIILKLLIIWKQIIKFIINSSVKVNIHINQDVCNYYGINKYEIMKKFDIGNETMKG